MSFAKMEAILFRGRWINESLITFIHLALVICLNESLYLEHMQANSQYTLIIVDKMMLAMFSR